MKTIHAQSFTGDLPEQFGRFRILGRLGTGSMGAVFLAHDPGTQRKVAVKVPFIAAADGPEVLDRFKREGQAVASIHHPNVCPVYEASDVNGVHFLAMKHLEGQTLAQRLKGQPQVTIEEAVRVVRDAALGLAEAHRHDVIHRDVKPSNIMLTGEGVFVMDFGLACRVDGQARVTQSKAILGTPAYMAPELLKGPPTRTPGCDVYSLGVVLYEALTGRLPYQSDFVGTLFHEILSTSPPAPSAINPAVPEELESICLRAMAREPASRFSSMADFASALDDYLAGVAGPTRPGQGAPPPVDASWSLPLADALLEEGRPAAAGVGRGWRRGWAQAALVLLGALLAAGVACFMLTIWALPLLESPPAEARATVATPLDTKKDPPSPPDMPRTDPVTRKEPVAPAVSPAEQHFREGLDALKRRDYKTALDRFKAVTAVDPTHARGYYYQGRLHTLLGDEAQALSCFSDALRFDREYADAYAARAVVHILLNQCNEALADATEALRRDATLIQAHIARRSAYSQRGEDEEAQRSDVEALRLVKNRGTMLPPQLPVDYTQRAAFFITIDQCDLALGDAEAALRMDPGCVEAHVQKAAAYHAKGMPREERDAYEEAFRLLAPTTARDHVRRARIALQLEKEDEVLDACDKALRLDPRGAEAYELRAQALYRKGQRAKTLAAYSKAATLLTPRFARDYVKRAQLYHAAEKYDLAIADAEHAIESAPTLAVAYERLGMARREKGSREATGAFKKGIEVARPCYAEDYHRRAWLYNEVRDYDRALEDEETALRLGLRSAAVYEELAYGHGHKNDQEKAEGYFEKALAATLNKATLYGYRGDMYQRSGNKEKALADYNKALDIDPLNAEALRGRGDLRYNDREYDESIRDYDAALKLKPQSATLHNARANAFFGKGDYGEAVRGYTAAIKCDPGWPIIYKNRADAYEKLGETASAEADRKKAEEVEREAAKMP